jgi:hypothetical protein
MPSCDIGWATSEFENVDLGDERLNQRLIKNCNSFSEVPESPINQSCDGWAETKAAYRFFKNEKVGEEKILEAHVKKTSIRSMAQKTIGSSAESVYCTQIFDTNRA